MILGLTGLATAGKDTGAAALLPLGFERVALADPMRDMLRALGVRDEHMNGPAKESPVPHLGLSYRRLAQTLGTEWGRALDPNLWCKVARERVYAVLARGAHVAVTDVRFDNEAEMLRAMGGRIVLVERPDARQVLPHASERGVDPALIDATVVNDGPREVLEARMRALVMRFGGC